MNEITLLYMVNATLLVLHEIESAYEKEWEILRLPGEITGFLLLHIPILFLMFYGLVEIQARSSIGLVIGMVLGVGGIIPFVVHKIIVQREEHFNRWVSNAVIYLNVVSGGSLVYVVSGAYAA